MDEYLLLHGKKEKSRKEDAKKKRRGGMLRYAPT